MFLKFRNLEKFGPIAEDVDNPGEKWLENRRQKLEVCRQLGETARELYFY